MYTYNNESIYFFAKFQSCDHEFWKTETTIEGADVGHLMVKYDVDVDIQESTNGIARTMATTALSASVMLGLLLL